MKLLLAALFIVFNLHATESYYFIQIKSYNDQAKALQFVKDIESEGIKPLIDIANLKEKGIWARVMFGGFKSKQLAEDFVKNNNLKSQFPDLWIKKIPKDKLNLYQFAEESVKN